MGLGPKLRARDPTFNKKVKSISHEQPSYKGMDLHCSPILYPIRRALFRGGVVAIALIEVSPFGLLWAPWALVGRTLWPPMRPHGPGLPQLASNLGLRPHKTAVSCQWRIPEITKVAGPLAQGVIDQFLLFILVCYPPLSPQGSSAPVPGRRGHYLGTTWIRSRVPGAPGSPQGDPKDPPDTREPLGPSQSSQGHPSEQPGCPRAPLGLAQGPPGRPKYHSRPPLRRKQYKNNVSSMFFKAPKDP